VEPVYSRTDPKAFFDRGIELLAELESRNIVDFDVRRDADAADPAIEALWIEHGIRRGTSFGNGDIGRVMFSRVDVGGAGWEDAVRIAEVEASRPDNITKLLLAPDGYEHHLVVGIMPGAPAQAHLSMNNLGILPKSHPTIPAEYECVWLAQVWGHTDGPAVRALWSWARADGWTDHPIP